MKNIKMTYQLKIFTLSLFCFILCSSLNADQTSITTNNKPTAEFNVLGINLAKYFPGSSPKKGNAADYYAEAFEIYKEQFRKLSSKVKNSPQEMEKVAEINRSIDLIVKGTNYLNCDFSTKYEDAISDYFHERPDSIGIMMLAKLIFRRAEKSAESGEFDKARKLCYSGIIFPSHLYLTAETSTQSSISLHVLTASFQLLKNVEEKAKQTGPAKQAAQLRAYFFKQFHLQQEQAPSFRTGYKYDLKSILEALVNPLPAVRLEGLRKLGNVIDPKVKIYYLSDPSYQVLRQNVIDGHDKIVLLLGNFEQEDPDPRVRKLAGQLKAILEKPYTLSENENKREDSITSTAIEQELNTLNKKDE